MTQEDKQLYFKGLKIGGLVLLAMVLIATLGSSTKVPFWSIPVGTVVMGAIGYFTGTNKKTEALLFGGLAFLFTLFAFLAS